MFITNDPSHTGWRNWLAQSWLVLILLVTLLIVASYSLAEAGWVRNSTPMTWCIYGGFLAGTILAASRFRGWAAMLFNLLLSVFIIVQAVERFLPSWEELTGGGQWVQVMNVRMGILINRFVEWWITYRSGKNIEDTRLFVFLIGLVLWHASAWMAWSVLRRSDGIMGCLPFGFLFGLNVYQAGQTLWRWVFFCILILCIIGYTVYRGKYISWIRRKMDYPEELGYEWLTLVVSVAIPMVIAARLLVFLGTPEAWQAISDLFTRPQQTTDDLASQLFADVKPPSPTREPDTSRGSHIETPNLSEIGGVLPNSTEMVMWVSVSDVNLPPQIGYIPVQVDLELPKHYWRSGVYAEYTGTGWEPAAKTGRSSTGETDGISSIPPGKFVLVQTFQLVVSHSEELFSVNNPVSPGEGVSLRQYVTGDTAVVEGDVSKYQVSSLANRVSRQQLQQAGEEYPETIRTAYLQLPDSLPDRVRDLAEHVTAGTITAYDKAIAIQDYLRANYEYMESVPKMTDGGDVVDYFLFDAPGGFCSYYASAMAVMLRSVGVPARVVTGYSTGGFDPSRSVFVVRMLDAHAWVEVYFPGTGWVEFEPTVSQTPFEYLEEASTSFTGETMAEEEPELAVWSWSTVLWCVRVLLVVGVIIFGVWFWLRREWRGIDRNRQAQALYRRIRQGLAWAGYSAPASVTPDEFLSGFDTPLSETVMVKQAIRLATKVYLVSTYSPHIPYYSDIHDAELAINHALPEFTWMVLKSIAGGRKNRPSWKWQEESPEN